MKQARSIVLPLAIVTLLSASGCIVAPPPPNPVAVARIDYPERLWDVWTVPEYVDGHWIAHIRIEMPEEDLDAWLQESGFPPLEQLEPGDFRSLATQMSEHIHWDATRRASYSDARAVSYTEQGANGFTRQLLVLWPGWGALVYIVAYH